MAIHWTVLPVSRPWLPPRSRNNEAPWTEWSVQGTLWMPSDLFTFRSLDSPALFYLLLDLSCSVLFSRDNGGSWESNSKVIEIPFPVTWKKQRQLKWQHMVMSLCGRPWPCPQRRVPCNARRWVENGARRKVDTRERTLMVFRSRYIKDYIFIEVVFQYSISCQLPYWHIIWFI